jgi:hypothetical protein
MTQPSTYPVHIPVERPVDVCGSAGNPVFSTDPHRDFSAQSTGNVNYKAFIFNILYNETISINSLLLL